MDEEYLPKAEVGDGGGDVLDEEYFSEAEGGVGGGAGAELDEEPVPLAIKVHVLSWLGGGTYVLMHLIVVLANLFSCSQVFFSLL